MASNVYHMMVIASDDDDDGSDDDDQHHHHACIHACILCAIYVTQCMIVWFVGGGNQLRINSIIKQRADN